MPRNPDLIDDLEQLLAPHLKRDQLQQRIVELRAKWGGRQVYVRKTCDGVPHLVPTCLPTSAC